MLYEDFWKSSCDWKKSTIYRSITNTIENKRSGKRKWLTRKQMIPVYDNDESIVDGIIHRKCADPELKEKEVRKHPEAPSVLQYLVLVEDHEKATEKEKIMDKFKLSEAQGDGSSDESDDDDDASSDDDDDDTPKKKSKKKGSKTKKKKEKKEKDSKKSKKKKTKAECTHTLYPVDLALNK